MIRLEARIPTARFTRLIGVPERSYRRWQHRQRDGQPVKGPWPTPSADRIEPTALAYADAYPQWGSKTIAMLMRADGHYGPDATVDRALRRNGRVLERNYQAERRQLAEARRAAFVVPPSGPNQVWQCDFTEFETRMGGTWRIGGVADYWSKLELGYHVATTQNHRDAIETVELALTETRRLFGRPLLEQARIEAPQRTDEERLAILAAGLIEEMASTPPIDLEMIASWQGVAKIQLEEIPWAGCLMNDGGQVIMKLRSNDSRRRRRFTGFHEVGHTFCPGFRLEPQYRCKPNIVPARTNIEGLCDIVASELLFPRRLVEADLAAADFGLDTVDELADRYDGSLEAAAHRFVNLWPEDTLLLVLEPGFRKSELDDPDAVAKLRVRSAHARGSWPYIPKNKSASDDSPPSRALVGELINERSTLDDLGVAIDDVDVSARLMPYRRDGETVDRVLALYRRPKGRA